jgi:hypothetical protein
MFYGSMLAAFMLGSRVRKVESFAWDLGTGGHCQAVNPRQRTKCRCAGLIRSARDSLVRSSVKLALECDRAP